MQSQTQDITWKTVCGGLKRDVGQRIKLPDMRILLLTPRAPILDNLKTVDTNSDSRIMASMLVTRLSKIYVLYHSVCRDDDKAVYYNRS